MTVMPANSTHWLVHYWQGKYGGLGHIYSPARTEITYPHLPYVLDNGAWPAFVHKRDWDAAAFVKHVERYAFLTHRPQWVVVPDVVADAVATIERWREWAPRLRDEYKLRCYLAVQNGMDESVINDLAPDGIFVGGTTEWKWHTLPRWTSLNLPVHVGRVNGREGLEICTRLGVASCDGSGWFRGKELQLLQLGHYLRQQAYAPNDGDVERVVKWSRLKNHSQLAMPMEEM